MTHNLLESIIESGKGSTYKMLPEKVLRNKAVVALHLCGFNQREIGDLLGSDKRNIQLFIKKYTPRYAEEIISRLAKKLSGNMIKPAKNLKEDK